MGVSISVVTASCIFLTTFFSFLTAGFFAVLGAFLATVFPLAGLAVFFVVFAFFFVTGDIDQHVREIHTYSFFLAFLGAVFFSSFSSFFAFSLTFFSFIFSSASPVSFSSTAFSPCKALMLKP